MPSRLRENGQEPKCRSRPKNAKCLSLFKEKRTLCQSIPYNSHNMKKNAIFHGVCSPRARRLSSTYVVKGKATPGQSVVYYRNLQSNNVDSVKVGKDGTFTLQGDAQQQPFLQLSEQRDLNNSLVPCSTVR